MRHGANLPKGQDKVTNKKWLNLTDQEAEIISFSLNIFIVGFACLGAAASAWLAIPSLLKLIPYQVPSIITNSGYFLSVISGITYAKAQFWDKSFNKIKQLLLGHESENQNEEIELNKKITDSITNIKNELEKLKVQHESLMNQDDKTKEILKKFINDYYKLRHPGKSEKELPNFSDKLKYLSNSLKLNFDLFNVYFNDESTSPKIDKVYGKIDHLGRIAFKVLEWLNWFFAVSIIFTGSSIAVILTTLGTKNAILSICADFLGITQLAGMAVWAPAASIAIFTQMCKLVINGHKQIEELMLKYFINKNLDKDIKHLEQKSMLLHDYAAQLSLISSSVEHEKKLKTVQEQRDKAVLEKNAAVLEKNQTLQKLESAQNSVFSLSEKVRNKVRFFRTQKKQSIQRKHVERLGYKIIDAYNNNYHQNPSLKHEDSLDGVRFSSSRSLRNAASATDLECVAFNGSALTSYNNLSSPTKVGKKNGYSGHGISHFEMLSGCIESLESHLSALINAHENINPNNSKELIGKVKLALNGLKSTNETLHGQPSPTPTPMNESQSQDDYHQADLHEQRVANKV